MFKKILLSFLFIGTLAVADSVVQKGAQKFLSKTTHQAGIDVTGGNLAVTNNQTIGGTLGVTGASSLSTLSANSTTLQSLGVTNNTTIGGTLGVTGNITGNLIGNASTVTTNANMSGPISSIGNVTSVNSQTGTGSTFVMSAGPTLTAPNLGAAIATSINSTSIPTSKTLVVTTDKLSALSSTSSSELAGVLSDETGTGSVVYSTSPTLTTPNLGTPSALVGTNITGTAAALNIGGNAATATYATTAGTATSAGTATTNANLTGPITSVGNATSVASQTGTGSTFVMSAGPTLTAPILGAATATSITSGSGIFTGSFFLTQATDAATTGANAALSVTTPTTVLTNASLTSIGSIASPTTGQTITLLNRTGASIVVVNEYASATAANRILTGSAQDLTLTNNASVVVQYSGSDSRWHVVGGSGSGGINVKGQTDLAYTAASNIQVPNNQATIIASGVTLLETGTGNILPDPGFEALTSGWTASGGATAAANSTAKGTGAKGFDWDSNSAAQTLVSTSVTIPNGYGGKNGVVTCEIKTPSGTATHTIVANDGTSDIGTAATILSSTNFVTSKYNFIFPTGASTIRIKISSVSSNEPEIYVDDCAIKLADNIADVPLITPVKDESSLFSFTGIGTPGAYKVYTNRVGDKLHIEGFVTSGTPTGSTFSINLPTKYVIDYTKNSTTANVNKVGDCSLNSSATTAFVNATSGVTHVFTDGSTTNAIFVAYQYSSQAYSKGTGSSFFSSGNTLSFKADIPILGWAAMSAVSADQTDYDWVSYTPTFTNLGTPTGTNIRYRRIGSTLHMKGYFRAGTTANNQYFSLPAGLAIDTSVAGASGASTLGFFNRLPTTAGTAITTGGLFYDSALGTGVLRLQTRSDSGLYETTSTSAVASSDGVSFEAWVPISGWTSNQRAPTLLGSVTSNASTAERLERASVTCQTNSATSIVNSQSGSWLTSPGVYNSTGNCTYTFAQAFSSTPTCVCSPRNTANVTCGVSAVSTTSVTISGYLNASSNRDDIHGLICMGPR